MHRLLEVALGLCSPDHAGVLFRRAGRSGEEGLGQPFARNGDDPGDQPGPSSTERTTAMTAATPNGRAAS